MKNPMEDPSKQVYFFTWGEKVKRNEKYEQKHQATNGKPTGKPSKQVYFFSWGEKIQKKQSEQKHQETNGNPWIALKWNTTLKFWHG